MDTPSAGPCRECGAALPHAFDARAITCGYCRKPQPNPRPLEIGQEVLLQGGPFGMLCGRVVASDGPDRIQLDQGGTKRLEELLPVRPLPLDAPGGLRVFVDEGAFNWKPKWLVQVDGETAIVKQDGAFDSDFFDKTVMRGTVRVSMRSDGARRRTMLPRWLKKAPIILFIAFFLTIVGLIARSFLF